VDVITRALHHTATAPCTERLQQKTTLPIARLNYSELGSASGMTGVTAQLSECHHPRLPTVANPTQLCTLAFCLWKHERMDVHEVCSSATECGSTDFGAVAHKARTCDQKSVLGSSTGCVNLEVWWSWCSRPAPPVSTVCIAGGRGKQSKRMSIFCDETHILIQESSIEKDT